MRYSQAASRLHSSHQRLQCNQAIRMSAEMQIQSITPRTPLLLGFQEVLKAETHRWAAPKSVSISRNNRLMFTRHLLLNKTWILKACPSCRHRPISPLSGYKLPLPPTRSPKTTFRLRAPTEDSRSLEGQQPRRKWWWSRQTEWLNSRHRNHSQTKCSWLKSSRFCWWRKFSKASSRCRYSSL